MRKISSAFTLAEVLITLAIIGIIATITIPQLIQTTQNQELVTGFKKFYSQANEALTNLAMAECSPSDIKNCFIDTDTAEKAIVNRFKTIKDCGYSSTDNCWAQYNYNYDGSGGNYDPGTDYHTFITADGMSVAVRIYDKNCLHHESSNIGSPMYNYCGDMIVDVNGLKKPNRQGRDVFWFNITSNKTPLLYPSGSIEDSDGSGDGNHYWNGATKYCQDSNRDGWMCAGRIIEEGWEMKY